jgi:hypothetical protein
MAHATGKAFSDMKEAATAALEFKLRGLKAVVIGPLDSAYITGPSGKSLDWPADGGKLHYLVIGSESEIARP